MLVLADVTGLTVEGTAWLTHCRNKKRGKERVMVTIKDIARVVGVSPSTVSRALSDSPLISEKTKQNVKEVAQRLGYERNELARG